MAFWLAAKAASANKVGRRLPRFPVDGVQYFVRLEHLLMLE